MRKIRSQEQGFNVFLAGSGNSGFAFCSINRLAVGSKPASNSLKPRYRRSGKFALRVGSHIEEIVTVAGCAPTDITNELLRILPIAIDWVISPVIVHGHACFPRTRVSLDGLFRSNEVAYSIEPVIDQYPWLKRADRRARRRRTRECRSFRNCCKAL